LLHTTLFNFISSLIYLKGPLKCVISLFDYKKRAELFNLTSGAPPGLYRNTVACRAVTMQRPSEMGGYTSAVSGQRLGKHVAVATQQILNNATVGLQQWKICVFYVVRARVSYCSGRQLEYSGGCYGLLKRDIPLHYRSPRFK
jgi:hypothetical protein